MVLPSLLSAAEAPVTAIVAPSEASRTPNLTAVDSLNTAQTIPTSTSVAPARSAAPIAMTAVPLSAVRLVTAGSYAVMRGREVARGEHDNRGAATSACEVGVHMRRRHDNRRSAG